MYEDKTQAELVILLAERDETIRQLGVANLDIEGRNDDLQNRLEATRLACEQAVFERDHDDLTGLWSRRAFSALARKTFSGGREMRDNQSVVLMFLDIDYLHEINRVAGREGGDESIRTIAEMLVSSFRFNAVELGRPDGDEIVGLFYGMTEEVVAKKLEEVRQAFMGKKLHVSKYLERAGIQHGFCFGIASGDHSMHFAKIYALADQRCTAEKGKRNITRDH